MEKKSNRLKIIRSRVFSGYYHKQPISIEKHLEKLAAKDNHDFKFYLISSSCNSSQLEGNPLNEDDYLKFKDAGILSKDVREIDDMITAYQFAQKHSPTMLNILKVHKLISKHFSLAEKYKGKFRDTMVRVWNGRNIVYNPADTGIVEREMNKLVSDIDLLISRSLSIRQIFYYASMIHLVFVSIHPFADGNGRMARLLEKWFLASKLGSIAWCIQSEKLYYKRSSSYYRTLSFRSNYTETDYNNSVPFLLLLPMALRIK